MKTVRINASKSYDVMVGNGLIEKSGRIIKDVSAAEASILVSDENVYRLYGKDVEKSLKECGIKTEAFTFAPGEKSKSLSVYSEILYAMSKLLLSRNDLVIALGGGVTGDLAGFAAATYKRGIDFVQIPTTLLAAVDSSVGGKTGINFSESKNQVGTIYQPSLVICDTDTLKTLPKEEYQNGCAEIIKYAMTGDKKLLSDIKSAPIDGRYEYVIERCVSLKREYVEKDERDFGIRMMLNFGHTVGHAVETLSGYTVSHGKAVAAGMAVITKAACKLNICDKEVLSNLSDLLDMYGLPSETSYSAEDISSAVMTDKKRQGAYLTLVVPKSLGECILKRIESGTFTDWLKNGGVE